MCGLKGGVVTDGGGGRNGVVGIVANFVHTVNKLTYGVKSTVATPATIGTIDVVVPIVSLRLFRNKRGVVKCPGCSTFYYLLFGHLVVLVCGCRCRCLLYYNNSTGF